MGLQVFDILLDNTQAAFRPGEVISGRVMITLTEEMKMRGVWLHISGRAHVSFRRSKKRHYGRQEYINTNIPLCGGENQDNFMHPVGEHAYPFQYTLPPNIPASFNSFHGDIYYYLQARIDIPWKMDHRCMLRFSVLGELDLNSVQGIQQGEHVSDSTMVGCSCCPSGPVTASMMLEKKGFVPGEYIRLKGDIVNGSKSKIKRLILELEMKVTSRARIRTDVSPRNVVVIRKDEGIPAGGSFSLENETILIPPVPPTELPFCDIIHIEYQVKLYVILPGGAFMAMNIPIVIGTVPLPGTAQYQGAQQAPPPVLAMSVWGKVTKDPGDEDEEEGGGGERLELLRNWAPQYIYYNWEELLKNNSA